MSAGGIGFGKYSDSKKKKIQEGDLIIVLGGDISNWNGWSSCFFNRNWKL